MHRSIAAGLALCIATVSWAAQPNGPPQPQASAALRLFAQLAVFNERCADAGYRLAREDFLIWARLNGIDTIVLANPTGPLNARVRAMISMHLDQIERQGAQRWCGERAAAVKRLGIRLKRVAR